MDHLEAPDPPNNIEAEQALLGAILINNEVCDSVVDLVTAGDFYQPVHGRIFDTALQLVAKGQPANPVTLKRFFDGDDGLADVGGVKYLARLGSAAVSTINAPSYATVVAEYAARRHIIDLAQLAIVEARDTSIDVADVLDGTESGFQALHPKSKRAGVHHISEVLAATWDAVMERFNRGGGLSGPTTGFRDIDRLIDGLKPGNVVVLGGRPSMGKTSLGLAVGLNAAQAGAGVGFLSLEMTEQELLVRALADLTWVAGDDNLAYQDIARGKLEQDLMGDPIERLRGVHATIKALPIEVIDDGGLNLTQIRAAARQMKRKLMRRGNDLQVLVVDHLNIIREPAGRNETETVRVGRISNALKTLGKQMNCCVLLLCQLNRGLESRDDKRPGLADLRWSGDIEQDADVVMFIHRESFYMARKRPDEPDVNWEADYEAQKMRAEIIVAKNRQGEAPKTIKLLCDIACSAFRDLGGNR